jgi:hypothetical protein
LLDGEIKLLLQYLEGGGNLLWLADPDEAAVAQPLADFLGIAFAGGTIFDVAGRLVGITDPGLTMITSSLYGSHDALAGFSFTTLFPRATTILASGSPGWTVTPLLSTGDHTWLETGPLDANSRYDAGAELQGPLTLGLSLERPFGGDATANPGRQKVVIVGDGDFLSNTYLDNSGNLDLGIRLINWLAGDEQLIQIPARTAADTQLTVSSITIGVTGLVFLLALPMLLLMAGAAIWWHRRRS